MRIFRLLVVGFLLLPTSALAGEAQNTGPQAPSPVPNTTTQSNWTDFSEKGGPIPEGVHPDWAEVRAKAVTGLLSSFYDPASAQITWLSGFRWGYSKPLIGRRRSGWIACGTVNAKNRLGGYVGATPFHIMADRSGAVTWGLQGGIRSSCDERGGPPPNPELVEISPPISGQTGNISVADELAKLAQLLEKGIITQQEFDRQKAKLLARY